MWRDQHGAKRDVQLSDEDILHDFTGANQEVSAPRGSRPIYRFPVAKTEGPSPLPLRAWRVLRDTRALSEEAAILYVSAGSDRTDILAL